MSVLDIELYVLDSKWRYGELDFVLQHCAVWTQFFPIIVKVGCI